MEDDVNINELKEEKEKLINKNNELLGELKQLKQMRNTLNEWGGLDKIKEVLIETEQNKEKDNSVEKESIDNIKSQYQEQLKTVQREMNTLKNGLVNTKLDSQLKSAVTKAGGEYDLLQHELKNRIKAEYVDNEQIRYEVLDDNGNPMIVDGRDARISDLVDSLQKHSTFGKAFNMNKTFTGSGATESAAVKITNNPFVKGENYSLDAQIELFKADPNKAKRLMNEAGLKVPRRFSE